MFELVSISYEESRLEYFRDQKAHCERCLDYWVNDVREGRAGTEEVQDAQDAYEHCAHGGGT